MKGMAFAIPFVASNNQSKHRNISMNRKLAELWLEFDREYRADAENKLKDTDELYYLLLWLESWIKDSSRVNASENVTFTEWETRGKQNARRMYDIKIRVLCAEKPVIGRIKIFALNSGSRLTDMIPYQRLMTDENGNGSLILPAGKWKIMVDHGIGYTVWEKSICLNCCEDEEYSEKNTKELEAKLEPLGQLGVGWIAGELHHHSIYSSPVYGGTDAVTASASQVKKSMQAAGCEFGALSDHHNILNHQEWKGQKEKEFCPVISKEISTSRGHVMSMGVDKDVIYNIPLGAERTEMKLRNEFIRITEEIRSSGGIPQLNHPFDTSVSTSWSPQFEDLFALFTTMEIWNGAHPMLPGNGNGKAVKKWISLLKQGIYLTGTAGSDTHNILADQYDEDAQKICCMLEWLKKKSDLETLPKEIHPALKTLLDMGQVSFPELLFWIGHSLGSACVKNYVHIDGELTQQKILQALRQGDCMITDGPLLFLERRENWTIRILTQEEPEKLVLLFEDGRQICREKEHFVSTNKREFNYVITKEELGKAKWMIAFLKTGERCRAVLNPVQIGI